MYLVFALVLILAQQPQTVTLVQGDKIETVTIQSAQLEYEKLRAQKTRTTTEEARYVALVIALGTRSQPQNLNACGDTVARCETKRGIRRPAQGGNYFP